MAIRLETTTDSVEEVKKAIGEVAETADDLIGEVETKPAEEKTPSESGAASETAEQKVEPTKEETPKKEGEEIPGAVKAELGKLRKERRELRERVARLENEKTRPAPQAKSEPAAPTSYTGLAKPKREDFQEAEDPDAAFIEALTDWKAGEKFAERDAKHDQDAATKEQKELIATYQKRLDDAPARYEDFDQTFDDLADDIEVTPVMQYAIFSSEVGPDMSYYLAKHPEVAKRINSLDRAGQIREMGKVEQKVEDLVAAMTKKPEPEVTEEKPEVAPRKPSQAPKPTTPLKTITQVTPKSKTEEDADRHVDHATFDKDYEKKRNEERKHRAS